MAATLGSIGTWLLGSPAREPEKPPQLQAVVVSLKTEVTIRGVLAEWAADALILKAASKATIGQNGRIEWAPIGGDVVIPLDNVDYWQAGLEPAVVVEE